MPSEPGPRPAAPGGALAPSAWAAVGALVLVTAVWGVTFVVIKQAILRVPPLEFLAIRFTIATAALAVLSPAAVARTRAPALRAGAIAGAALGAGYALQTLGLQTTGATNAGFVTGLFVVFTPLVWAIALRRLPSRGEGLGVLLAVAGLVLLILGLRLELRPQPGDMLVLGCAGAFAVHIVLLGRVAPKHDPRALALVQLAVPAAGFAVVAPLAERLVVPAGASVWFALLLTAVVASALAFLAQTWAQRRLTPTQTAVTLTMEPVFAGISGYLLLGERLTAAGWAGACLILAAMLLAAVGAAPAQKIRRQRGEGSEPSW